MAVGIDLVHTQTDIYEIWFIRFVRENIFIIFLATIQLCDNYRQFLCNVFIKKWLQSINECFCVCGNCFVVDDKLQSRVSSINLYDKVK